MISKQDTIVSTEFYVEMKMTPITPTIHHLKARHANLPKLTSASRCTRSSLGWVYDDSDPNEEPIEPTESEVLDIRPWLEGAAVIEATGGMLACGLLNPIPASHLSILANELRMLGGEEVDDLHASIAWKVEAVTMWTRGPFAYRGGRGVRGPGPFWTTRLTNTGMIEVCIAYRTPLACPHYARVAQCTGRGEHFLSEWCEDMALSVRRAIQRFQVKRFNGEVDFVIETLARIELGLGTEERSNIDNSNCQEDWQVIDFLQRRHPNISENPTLRTGIEDQLDALPPMSRDDIIHMADGDSRFAKTPFAKSWGG